MWISKWVFLGVVAAVLCSVARPVRYLGSLKSSVTMIGSVKERANVNIRHSTVTTA